MNNQHYIEIFNRVEESFTPYVGKLHAVGEAASKVRRNIAQDYERNRPFSTKDALTKLDADMAAYRQIFAEAENENELCDRISDYVAYQIETLYFGDNDYPTACMRHDLLNSIFTACSVESPALSEASIKKLKKLDRMFGNSLSAYAHLCDHVADSTHGEYHSILDLAERMLHEEGVDAPTEQAINDKAGELFRDALQSLQMDYAPDQAPHPSMLMHAKAIQDMAFKRAYDELGQRATDEERVHAISKHQTALHEKIQGVVAKNPSHEVMADVSETLEEEWLDTFHLPDDFHDILEDAHSVAAEYAESRVSKHFQQMTRDKNWHQSHGSEYAQQVGIVDITLPSAQLAASHYIRNIGRDLVEARNLEEVVDNFDFSANDDAHDAVFGSAPATALLFMRDYVDVFRQEISKKMAERRLPFREFAKQMEAVRDKYDAAYQSCLAASDWCMEASGGAYSDYYIWACIARSAVVGRHAANFTKEDHKAIEKIVEEFHDIACDQHAIPHAWRTNPFVPLLFEKCYEAVERTYAHHESRDRKESGKLHGAYQKTDGIIPPTEIAPTRRQLRKEFLREHKLEGRALDMLKQVMATFPPVPPPRAGFSVAKHEDPTQYDPAMMSESLRDAMQLLTPVVSRQH